MIRITQDRYHTAGWPYLLHVANILDALGEYDSLVRFICRLLLSNLLRGELRRRIGAESIGERGSAERAHKVARRVGIVATAASSITI
jgi:hypothetical protein